MITAEPFHRMIDYCLCSLPMGDRDVLLAAKQKDEATNTHSEHQPK